MAASEVWVAKDDGSELVRAGAIAAVSRDYTGTVTVRLSGGEQSAVTLVTVASHGGKHTPDDFHRQLLRAVAQLADAAQAAVVRPVCDDHGWRWANEPL
ncbi:MAG TPA: hypothetical protein VIP48_02415 [Streptosporangiaceae bacterium]